MTLGSERLWRIRITPGTRASQEGFLSRDHVNITRYDQRRGRREFGPNCFHDRAIDRSTKNAVATGIPEYPGSTSKGVDMIARRGGRSLSRAGSVIGR